MVDRIRREIVDGKVHFVYEKDEDGLRKEPSSPVPIVIMILILYLLFKYWG
jgi:hypothetical protein